MEQLFVYGTLLESEVQRREIGRVTKSQKTTLKDFKKSTVKIQGKTYPIAVETKGDSINGEIIEITPEELVKLDIYETKAYRRVKATTENGTQVWAYVK